MTIGYTDWVPDAVTEGTRNSPTSRAEPSGQYQWRPEPNLTESAIPTSPDDSHMKVLVAFSSKYGSTAQIAKYIADRLTEEGLQAHSRNVETIDSIGDYDAFVIGSAAFVGSWMQEATEFVRRHRETLVSRPVWLFSSGPLGTDPLDQKGRDKLEVAVPREIAEFVESIRPVDHRVFFGALTPSALETPARLMRLVPAGRRLLEEGDFRDWDDIAAWAAGIAAKLVAEPSAAVEP
jgi:menaquinone-dependent protoporphyrinogen oxidase